MGVKELLGLLLRLENAPPFRDMLGLCSICFSSDTAETLFELIGEDDVDGFSGEGILGAYDALLPRLEPGGVVDFSGWIVILWLVGVFTSDRLEAGDDPRVRISAAFCSSFKEESERPACMVSQVFATSFPRSAVGRASGGGSIASYVSMFYSAPIFDKDGIICRLSANPV
jgi:hypothetical protein